MQKTLSSDVATLFRQAHVLLSNTQSWCRYEFVSYSFVLLSFLLTRQ